MNGFKVKIHDSPKTTSNNGIVYKCLNSNRTIQITLSSHHKFKNDECLVENDHFIWGIEGVLLNLKKLIDELALGSIQDILLYLYKKHGLEMPNYLEGEYSGFVFNKAEDELMFFNNVTGSRPVFYYQYESELIISPDIIDLTKRMKMMNKNVHLDLDSAYALLCFGGMLENRTLVHEVFRLNAGEMIVYSTNQLTCTRYFDLNNVSTTGATEANIQNDLYDIFEENIKLEYSKDEEYNYSHLATLSGGLDSRLNVMMALGQNYRADLLCFSQPEYYDHRIAKDIAEDLSLNLNFVPLDGSYILDLEENMKLYQGSMFYCTSAHFRWALNFVDLAPYGIMHSGLLGDGILGNFITAPTTQKPKLQKNYLSTTLKPKIENFANRTATNYASEESYNYYNRFCNVVISGSWALSQETVLTSPFMTRSFIEYAASIPPELKFNQKFYISWINKKMPNVNKYKWERTKMRPLYAWQVELSRYTNRLRSIYLSKFKNSAQLLSMTPYDHWMTNDHRISEFMSNVFNADIALVKANKELYGDINLLWRNGSALEKTCVLTLLSAIKMFDLKV